MNIAATLPWLLALAWLLPLASFAVLALVGSRLGLRGRYSAWVATGAILGSCVLSLLALFAWVLHSPLIEVHHAAAVITSGPESPQPDAVDATIPPDFKHYSGSWYSLGEFGPLRLELSYYIDALTICMFVMVTIIASLIHFYAYGYMQSELQEVTDPEVLLADQSVLKRPGRFAQFFQYLSLFCFSMLGILIAGNLLMVFIFWELVGICSFFLIGFYRERRSAAVAANKAFITNRIGDFGMLVGMMVLFGTLGTLSFSDTVNASGDTQPGIFNSVRSPENNFEMATPDGMVRFAARQDVGEIVRTAPSLELAQDQIAAQLPIWRDAGYGYWLLVLAGLGVFCGCIGKSAQFPLHVWLPDAMEGPTPVSALVHSATMVAAGVYLAARFYPIFTPEVLLIIAYVGAITLFIAATMALVALDIKRVLAYSTISQLGFMMLALGVGGWLAAIFHLLTHAFFKSLLFMGSGSVIHATHTNDLLRMGGLRHKMPWTAYTMLIGCLAIAGAGLPFAIGPFSLGLSGYYSKDAIISQVLMFGYFNPLHNGLFYLAIVGAGLTAFYMFRLWYLTFAGKPRDAKVFAHVHESPLSMRGPLIVAAVFAVVIAWRVPGTSWELINLIEQARWIGIPATGAYWPSVAIPFEPELHASTNAWMHHTATFVAALMASVGFGLATLLYGLRRANPDDAQRQFRKIYNFLWHKWWFDELYSLIFIRPTLVVAGLISLIDRRVIDPAIQGLAWAMQQIARWDDWFDQRFVDGLVNWFGQRCYTVGNKLHQLQTGQVRHYVMFAAVGTVALFILATFFLNVSGFSKF